MRRSTRRVVACVVAGSVVPVGGCRKADRPPATSVDSAGVEIVTSAPDPPRWATTPEPILSLGSTEGGGPEELHRVTDVELLEGGGLAIANAGSEEVRLFDADGRFLGAFGGEGRGPEEFLRLSMVQDFADSLLTYDGGNDRISVRTADGTFVRSFRLEWFQGMLFPTDLGPRGEILAVTARHMTDLQGTGIVVDTSLVSLYDRGGSLLDSLVRIPHNERFVRQRGVYRTTLGAPFGAWASLVAVDGGFCEVFGPVPEIRCRDGRGRLHRVLRVDEPSRPVTEADIAWFREDALSEEGAPGSGVQRMRQILDDLIYPATFPAFSTLLRDDEGRLWARRYTRPDAPDEEWLVFEDDRLAGTLRTPLGFEVMDVEAGRVAGVWRDELGVEHVRVYGWRPS